MVLGQRAFRGRVEYGAPPYIAPEAALPCFPRNSFFLMNKIIMALRDQRRPECARATGSTPAHPPRQSSRPVRHVHRDTHGSGCFAVLSSVQYWAHLSPTKFIASRRIKCFSNDSQPALNGGLNEQDRDVLAERHVAKKMSRETCGINCIMQPIDCSRIHRGSPVFEPVHHEATAWSPARSSCPHDTQADAPAPR